MMGQPRDLRTLTSLLRETSSALQAGAYTGSQNSERGTGDQKSGPSNFSSEESNLVESTGLSDANELQILAASFSGITPLQAEQLPIGSPPLELLKESIRAAIQLEFATVPPYLTALWSIIDQAHPVAKVIRAVAHEEMLHVAILCNLLSALGERPVLTGAAVPRYPSNLPRGVHPELLINLLGYSREALVTFLEIERPEEPLAIEGEPDKEFPAEDNTIGEFYVSLLDTYEKLLPQLDARHQIAGPFVWFVMTTPDDVRKALRLIMAQGEGARGEPYSHDPRHLAHYYRFRSLQMSVELIWDPGKKVLRKGNPFEQPSVFTLAPANSQGFGLAVPRELREANDRFEVSYSRMLRLLEESWSDGGHKSFVQALEHMFELTQLAQTIMRIGTPDGRSYCPAFLYRP